MRLVSEDSIALRRAGEPEAIPSTGVDRGVRDGFFLERLVAQRLQHRLDGGAFGHRSFDPSDNLVGHRARAGVLGLEQDRPNGEVDGLVASGGGEGADVAEQQFAAIEHAPFDVPGTVQWRAPREARARGKHRRRRFGLTRGGRGRVR